MCILKQPKQEHYCPYEDKGKATFMVYLQLSKYYDSCELDGLMLEPGARLSKLFSTFNLSLTD